MSLNAKECLGDVMRLSPVKNEAAERKHASTTVIAFIAALMGLGQGGLLVSLPVLVSETHLSLTVWSMVIATGSVLFLPASPYWGRQSDLSGPKSIVLQALVGFGISFGLLYIFVSFANTSNLADGWVITGLVVARVIYGLTVAGMVPAAQHWAVLIKGEENRLEAITTISAGMSAGRLLGPLIAIALLNVHPLAPLITLTLLPLLGLLVAKNLPDPREQLAIKVASPAPFLPPRRIVPFLLIAMLGSTALALMQYMLTPMLQAATEWSVPDISNAVGALLTISAAITLATQLLVIKRRRISVPHMLEGGSVLMLTGYTLFLSLYWPAFFLAVACVAAGGALFVPAYVAEATSRMAAQQGTMAGYIAMSHTLGYGLSAALVMTLAFGVFTPIWINIALSGAIFAVVVALSLAADKNE